MSDRPVVMAVASYRSRAQADRDFLALRGSSRDGERGHLASAVLEKGADGQVAMDCHDVTVHEPVWGVALLGGALSVIAAPLGIRFLAKMAGTGGALAGVSAIASHFWHNIAKDELRQMSELLEAGQAALLVVAVDHSRQDVGFLLPNAAAKLVADSMPVDFEADFSNAVDEANAID